MQKTALSLIAATIALAPSLAMAQEAAPAAPAAAPPAAPAPAPAPAAEPAAEAPAEPAMEPEPAPAAVETDMSAEVAVPAVPMEESSVAEEATPVEEPEEEWPSGWFRVDHDALGLQLWFGATHDIGGVGVASDIYIAPSADVAEFDLGVEIPVGPVTFLPMAGINFNWSKKKADILIAPQLFTYADLDPFYIEWWSQFFFATPFQGGLEESVVGTAGNIWYNRIFALYNITDMFAIGPQMEATLALNDAAKAGDKTLTSLPFGGRLNANYGKDNTLGIFLGYEFVEEGRGYEIVNEETGETAPDPDLGLVGRFTFIRTW